MGRDSTFTAAEREFIAQKYLSDVPPRDILPMLEKTFARKVTPAALRQWISRSGLTERKAQLDRKICSIVSGATAKGLAKANAAKPAEHLERFAEKSVNIADKALTMAEGAGSARELASATAAAKTAITMFRICAGIDGPGSGGPRAANFNFHFASWVPPERTGDEQPQPVIRVTCQPGDRA